MGRIITLKYGDGAKGTVLEVDLDTGVFKRNNGAGFDPTFSDFFHSDYTDPKTENRIRKGDRVQDKKSGSWYSN